MKEKEEFTVNTNEKALPTIPLRGMVVLPDTTVTLDLGRQRSINAFKSAVGLDGGNELFLVAQKDADVSQPTQNELYSVGVIVSIENVAPMESETTKITVRVITPAKIVSATSQNKMLISTVCPIEYTNADNLEVEMLMRRARELAAQLAITNPRIDKQVFAKLAIIDEPIVYCNVATAELVYKVADKQEVLQTIDSVERFSKLCIILANEVEIAKLDKKIAIRVRKQIDKGQKDYYLKEQMRAISKELGEDEDEIAELEAKIKASQMPKDIEVKALKEVRRMQKMNPSSPDASVIRGYVEWLTDLSWNTQTEDNKDLIKARDILDEDHFGLLKIKERIIEYLAVMQLTKGLNGPILCFVGPPGVGKTSIVKSIARALDRKYVRMSLGGVRDEAEIRGHRRTYIGAIPGKVIYMMKQAQCVNPVLLFDEIDKMSSDFRGDPASAMLEVLDPEQNCTFVDHFLEVPYDLSKVLFVCTANTVDSIPPALLDRMEIIELSGYTEEEKMEIATHFLVPKQEKMHGIEPKSISFTNDAIRCVISQYTRESGVRTLEREIATICRKVALKIVNEKLSFCEIKQENVEEYLGIPKYKDDLVDIEDEVGSATGLAVTAVGGVTLTVDVTLFSGNGEILLTGMLGDVMKESARAAISMVKSRADEYCVDPTIFQKTDIHIHIPEGAIPKDGPSAGVTMATAIMSAFCGLPVSKKVAMTGEVTLRGKVLPIGGVKEKTLAAYRAGIRKIIIPAENKVDAKEIPPEVAQNIEIVFASDISTVFQTAIVGKPTKKDK